MQFASRQWAICWVHSESITRVLFLEGRQYRPPGKKSHRQPIVPGAVNDAANWTPRIGRWMRRKFRLVRIVRAIEFRPRIEKKRKKNIGQLGEWVHHTQKKKENTVWCCPAQRSESGFGVWTPWHIAGFECSLGNFSSKCMATNSDYTNFGEKTQSVCRKQIKQ